MMPSQEVQSEQVSELKVTGIGPGDRLQAARIEAGLSIEDVANRMHLSVSILESIEENNFEEITAPIFVKGYLRAYARIVSLSEDDMIQQYVNFYSGEDPPINSTSNTSPEISADDARIKWTTYIVIFVLCGLLAAWWWNKNQNQGDVVSLDVEGTDAVTVEPANDSPEPEIASSNENSVESIVATTTVEETQDSIEVVTPEPEPELEPISDVEPESAAEPEPVVEPDPVVETGLPTISEETAETNPVVEPVVVETSNNNVVITDNQTAPSGTDKLEIVINADTWADIKDANGHRLTYDLLRADQQLTLIGQAPFSVFFGNGHGVEITFNEEEVDISGRTRDDNTARLKIGNN